MKGKSDDGATRNVEQNGVIHRSKKAFHDVS
jgi:hypothetical protein